LLRGDSFSSFDDELTSFDDSYFVFGSWLLFLISRFYSLLLISLVHQRNAASTKKISVPNADRSYSIKVRVDHSPISVP
jgi:hypothetical protein